VKITAECLAGILAAKRIIDEDAIYESEGYDGGSTMRMVALAAESVNEHFSPIESSTWPVALAFARKMDAALQANMHKGTREEWISRSPDATANALACLAEDAAGLAPMDPRCCKDSVKNAINLAAYCLMLADACGGMEEVKP
jgi:hypothetical protein